ncbi:hypothetical protein ES731_04235 [Psychroflexus gondwanensis]|jgi:uncharacterized protein YneF (UPF0154 family)|uniref:Uncharacterized protein n=1 Tax=Psychroflexus gondwanensis ACAM 44 TaxID=1189619 RepID=N1WXB1_9FLAO|nr:hypothetical protein pgond44_04500 [Psychroflexus gondwanensis ACAM 44]TXE20882.1 hypothetical protein ES731_04235 [Psychroflexus gondwanensis]
MIYLIILISLLLINLALLKFSCDCPDFVSKKSKKKLLKKNIKINTPKVWSKETTASDPVLADK